MTPRLRISPSQLTARAGDRVVLTCEPGAGPGPYNIEWQRVNALMPPSASESADGQLTIERVTAADAGRYRCVATNSLGTSEGFAVLTVASK